MSDLFNKVFEIRQNKFYEESKRKYPERAPELLVKYLKNNRSKVIYVNAKQPNRVHSRSERSKEQKDL